MLTCGRDRVTHHVSRHVFQPVLSARGTRRASSTVFHDKTIFSGIQPTGIPHLGNYLGALRQWVKRQDEVGSGRCIYSIVDLHSITVPQDAQKLRDSKRATFATLLAIGLDPERSIIFHQSSVPAHSELMWILSCQASVGYLNRMTQWKSKLDLHDHADAFDARAKAKLKLGLFSYPVLQAADILVHRATHVPVGQDQSQHLEFARECANGFNHVHGNVLVSPETILSPAKRVMALNRPEFKMSKSHTDPKSRILLTDDRDTIHAKFKSALTDSIDGITYDPQSRPGVSNLIEIAYHMTTTKADAQTDSVQEFARDLQGLSMKALKSQVADVVDGHLAPIRDRIWSLLETGSQEIDDAAAVGQQKATRSAATTMRLVHDAVGL